jgi:hypothetical protein
VAHDSVCEATPTRWEFGRAYDADDLNGAVSPCYDEGHARVNEASEGGRAVRRLISDWEPLP